MFKWTLLVICVADMSYGLRNVSVEYRKNVTFDAASLMKAHLPWFLKLAPFFDLTKIPAISPMCRRDFQTFLDGIDKLELWALKSNWLVAMD